MAALKEFVKCFISCILPCGALDVARIFHANGRVEEIAGGVTAAEIMKLYPKHILKRLDSSSLGKDDRPRIVVVSPESVLKRGRFYFLVPVAPPPPPQKPEKGKQKKGLGENRSRSGNLIVADRSGKSAPVIDRRRRSASEWRPQLEAISESPACVNDQ